MIEEDDADWGLEDTNKFFARKAKGAAEPKKKKSPKKVGWGCVKAYDNRSSTNKAQRAKSCAKVPGGTFKTRQLCVEDCYWNTVEGKEARAWTKIAPETESESSEEERYASGDEEWRPDDEW